MYHLGIDIGGTFVKMGLVSPEGTIIAKKSVKTNFDCGYAMTIREIAEAAIDLTESMGLNIKDLGGVGIGVPGSVHEGTVTFANNLKWMNVPVVQEFKRYLDTKIEADNDANCAVWGEYIVGAAKPYNNVLLITLGTGLGSGFIVNGKIMSGFHGAGSEGGHIVIKSGGLDCNCGRRGCYEQYAATTAMIRLTNESIKAHPDGVLAKLKEKAGEVNGFTLFDGVRAGDKIAREVLDGYINDVAEGLVNLVNIMRPEIVLIGGGISNEEELLINPLEEIVNRYAYGGDLNPHVSVKKALLGNNAGTVGAACLTMQKK
jgi:glucokinase